MKVNNAFVDVTGNFSPKIFASDSGVDWSMFM